MSDALSFAGVISAIIIFGVLFGNLEKALEGKSHLRGFFGLTFWIALLGFFLIPVTSAKEAWEATNAFDRAICCTICFLSICLMILALVIRLRQAPSKTLAGGDGTLMTELDKYLCDIGFAQEAESLKEEAFAAATETSPFWETLVQ